MQNQGVADNGETYGHSGRIRIKDCVTFHPEGNIFTFLIQPDALQHFHSFHVCLILDDIVIFSPVVFTRQQAEAQEHEQTDFPHYSK
jgi:hypothetical protein